jgi:Ser/Thr protein kinase RdoA (MazF antagonist)
MEYVSGSYTKDNAENVNDAFEAGRILSLFHLLLKDEDPTRYIDTLDNFHKLPYRITEFEIALENSNNNLIKECREEINYSKEMFDKLNIFYNSKLPERICHNDAKLNNILFSSSNKGLCMIDMDTIMKGYFHYDFGDAVRTIVNPASEEEKDLSKIIFNKSLFKAFIDGLKSNGEFLSKKERELLPLSTALMPFIHGLRALTDYLNGNIYYKVSYPKQNLIRCKNLYAFSRLALEHKDYMKEIIES